MKKPAPPTVAIFLVTFTAFINNAATQQSFTLQPSSITKVAGSDATFTCSVQDKEGVLSWSKDGATISSDGGITNGNSRLSIVGDTTNGVYNLQISTVLSSDEGTYVCTVAAAGTSTEIVSTSATLTVSTQQAFQTTPEDVTATVGDTVSLTCSVSDKEGSLTWLKGSTVISSETTILVSDTRISILDGGNTGVQYDLQITNSEVDDTGEYKCAVTSVTSTGQQAIESDVAQVTVSEPIVQRFTTQPSSTQADVDNMATLYCVVENLEGNVLWYKDNQAISENREITIGNNNLAIVGDEAAGEYNLRVLVAEEDDEGTYYCKCTAAGGSTEITSSVAFLDINSEGQRLTMTPVSTQARVSATVTLYCQVANQNGNLLWLQDGKTISNNREVNAEYTATGFSVIGNETLGEYFLQIEDVSLDDAATYICAVTGTPSTSATAQLEVLEAVAPDTGSPQCYLPSNELAEGVDIMLICSSQGGDPEPTLVWSNGAEDLQGVELDSAFGIRLGLPLTLGPEIQGNTYTCTSNHVTYTELKTCVIGPLAINLIPRILIDVEPSVLEVIEGQQSEFRCNATGDPPVTGYMWYYSETKINTTDRRFEHDEGNTVLRIVSAEKSMDNSKIRCEAKNGIDTQSATASIKIVDPALNEDDTLSFRFLAAVVALIGGIILTAIIIAIIIYRVYKKRRDEDDDDDDDTDDDDNADDTAHVIGKDGHASRSGKKGGLVVPPHAGAGVLNSANYFANGKANKKGRSLPPIQNGHSGPPLNLDHFEVVYESHSKKKRARGGHKKKKSRIIKHNVVDPVNDRRKDKHSSEKDGRRSRSHDRKERERDRDDKRSRSESSRRTRDSKSRSRRDDEMELDRYDDDRRRSDRRERRDDDDRRPRSRSEGRHSSRRDDREDDRYESKSRDRHRAKSASGDRHRSRDREDSRDRSSGHKTKKGSRKRR